MKGVQVIHSKKKGKQVVIDLDSFSKSIDEFLEDLRDYLEAKEILATDKERIPFDVIKKKYGFKG